MLFYQVNWQYLMHACFIVLQLRSDSCQIHGYVMLCQHCCRFWQQCCRFRQQFRTKFRPFDKVETNWTCSICFNFVERTKFYNRITESFDIVAVCGNKVECCFDKVERLFDNVAGVDGVIRITTGESRKTAITDIATSCEKSFETVGWATSE